MKVVVKKNFIAQHIFQCKFLSTKYQALWVYWIQRETTKITFAISQHVQQFKQKIVDWFSN